MSHRLLPLLFLLLAATCQAIPNRVATVLVRVVDGRVVDRRAGSDRYTALRYRGWVRAARPPGVCVRTALRRGDRVWLDYRAAHNPYAPNTLPVVWEARGLARYRARYGNRGPVPLPDEGE